MRWGFTGSQKGCDTETLVKALDPLLFKPDDWLVTGGCIGVDAQVYHLCRGRFPDVQQLVIFPWNQSKCDTSIAVTAEDIIFMPEGSDYRMRNERLVEESDRVIAFWTGQERSGTYMTMNIARRAGKLWKVVRI